MKRGIIILVLIQCYSILIAQHKEGFNWITGTNGCRVSFNTIDTTPNTFKAVNYPSMFLQGSSCISDRNGRFLFSCDGYNIWDTLGNGIENGDSLCPTKIVDNQIASSLTQTSLILPFSESIYYVITPTVSDTTFDTYWHNTSGIAPFDLLLYHKIDMKENSGKGRIVKKAIPLIKNKFISKSQMQACRHANGIDWWLLKQALDSNIVYKFLITKDSVFGPFVQNFMPFRFGIFDNYGQACFNKEGTKYSVVQSDIPASVGLGGMHENSQLFIADFDRCTGELSNPEYYNIPNFTSYNTYIDSFYGGQGDHGANGVCFSESGYYLYVAKFANIFQFDISEPDSSLAWKHIAGLDTSYFAFQRYQGIYLGPDHKLYIGNVGGSTKQISVINKPNLKGALCEFCPRCLRFPLTGISAPPNMPDYTLGPSALPCPPVDTGGVKIDSWSFYPNPATQVVIIKNAKGKRKLLYDAMGQIIFSTIKDEIEVGNLSKGLYFLSCDGHTKKVLVE